MNLTQIVFYFFAAITIGGAVFMVTTKNIIYAAFSLLATFLGVAAIYVYAKADFIAVAQLVVYVGGILVLLLFGVMLTNRVSGQKMLTQERNKILGFILSGSFLVILLQTISKADFDSIHWIKEARRAGAVIDPAQSSLSNIGINTMTDYLLPFEVIALVLMVALLGAAYMARRDTPKGRKVNQ